ncbi:MAG: NB-ARC domain-containing protein [Prolixibacteraceae bacterium]|jgi:cold shock CspA family protein|nr:NB-ARC domain-containing protein [Prolixibacteraceae bacterium]
MKKNIDNATYRKMTTMIVFALEQSLGQLIRDNQIFCKDRDLKSIDSVINRVKKKNIRVNSDIESVLSNTYMSEVFDIALELSNNTSVHDDLRKLEELCKSLNLFDIRNAIAHPNKDFPVCYWYRICAIATDPLIGILGLNEITANFEAAIQNKIDVPPDSWINKYRYVIPNTLPRLFEHDITGLIGREDEFKNLDRNLASDRISFISIIAPGGVGKTALILQYLKRISEDVQWTTKLDGIIFQTLKNERLEKEGIEKIKAISGISQIKEAVLNDLNELFPDEISHNIDEALSLHRDKKLIICVDNLETLLMQSPDDFVEFNLMLPSLWRVIVTSRIPIDSATNIRLKSLNKKSATHLGIQYATKKGVDLSPQMLENIAEKSNNNPLAIRLTVDLYSTGKSLTESMLQSQSNIVDFSYRNLIDSLSDNAVSILEVMYILGSEVQRKDLVSYLELTFDDIQEAINNLTRTSLIFAKHTDYGEAFYSLSESIRDLLIRNPRNILIRNQIQARVQSRRVKIQQHSNKTKQLEESRFSDSYIGTDDENLRSIIIDINKELDKKKYKLNINETLLVEYRSKLELYGRCSENYELHFHQSRIHDYFNEHVEKQNCLERAYCLNINDPRVNLALAICYFKQKRIKDAIPLFEKNMEKNLHLPDKSDKKFSFSLINCYLHSLLESAEYSKIEEVTKDWINDEQWAELYGTFLASMHKRSVEHLVGSDLKSCEDRLIQALNIYDIIFTKLGYNYTTTKGEYHKLLEQMVFIIRKYESSKDFIKKCTDSVSRHYKNTSYFYYSLDSKESISLLTKLVEFGDDEFKNQQWLLNLLNLQYDQNQVKLLEEEGYSIVRITGFPYEDKFCSYCFAIDSEKTIFLHIDNFQGNNIQWSRLDIDDKVAVKYEETQKGYNATSIVLLKYSKI